MPHDKPRDKPEGVRKISVLIVDDRRAFAQALATVMSLEPDLLARTVSFGPQADRAVVDEAPDVVLLDAARPGPDGVEMAARMLESVPGLRILILSVHEDDLTLARGMSAGVYGFVSTYEPLDRVLAAVRRTAAGEPMITLPDAARLGIKGRRRRLQHATEGQRSERLSVREREILQLMTDGLEPTDIVARLGISSATLRTHVQNILTKLGVHSKTQAVLLAVRQGKVTARG